MNDEKKNGIMNEKKNAIITVDIICNEKFLENNGNVISFVISHKGPAILTLHDRLLSNNTFSSLNWIHRVFV